MEVRKIREKINLVNDFFNLRPFEYLILVSIFLNCVALAVYTPYPNKDNDKINSLLVRFCFFYN